MQYQKPAHNATYNVNVTGIRDIDGQLGAYPYESLKTWYSLTNHITEPVMKRLVLNTLFIIGYIIILSIKWINFCQISTIKYIL